MTKIDGGVGETKPVRTSNNRPKLSSYKGVGVGATDTHRVVVKIQNNQSGPSDSQSASLSVFYSLFNNNKAIVRAHGIHLFLSTLHQHIQHFDAFNLASCSSTFHS